MGDLATAKKSRTGSAGWLTRTANVCEKLAKEDLKQVGVIEYEVAIDNFSTRLANWDDCQNKVESLMEEAELMDEIDSAADFREKSERSRNNLITAWATAHPQVDEESESVSTSRSGFAQTVKLPKIDLPKFSGDILKFDSFWQQFLSCVDNQDLPDITKFNYFVGLLKGVAKGVIEGLPVTADNYVQAKDLIKKRFGRKELIIFAHVQALLMVDPTKMDDLLKLYDQLQAHIRALASLGITSQQFGVILTPVILSCIPDTIRLEWSRDSEGKEADLDHLMDFLEKEINRRERSRSFGGLGPIQEPKKPPEEAKTVSGRKSVGSATALHVASSKSSGFSCGFCSKKHLSEKCFKYLRLDVKERQSSVAEHRLCFRCLSRDHIAKFCQKVCSNCKANHHLTLCYREGSSAAIQGAGVSSENSAQLLAMDASVLTVTDETNVPLLPTATVKVRCSDGSFKSATLLFDGGSERSFMSQSLVKQTQPVFVKNQQVSFSTFGGRSHGSKSRVFSVSLYGRSGLKEKQVELTEVPVICSPLSRPSVSSKVFKGFEHLDLAFDYCEVGQPLNIDVLIGQDLFWELMGDGVYRHPVFENVVAQESLFGWVIQGGRAGANSGIALLNLCTIPDDCVKRFWDLEFIGVCDKEEIDPTLEEFKQNIQYNEDVGRYCVGLTWKHNHPVLLDNKNVALASLLRLERRLDKNPALKEGYVKALEEMERLGFVEEVVDDEGSSRFPIFYLPHHPCVKESSTSTKIRPVFNASSKGRNGVSLNDCLNSGPNLNPGIVEVVIRFRRWRFAVSSDVSKAFLQILLQRKDQDVHRFLWRKGGEVKIMRFLRVTFGVKCSPFLLAGTVQHHLSLCPPSTVVKELSENLYVDDFLSGADDEQEVATLYEEANKVMEKAGMKLAKWASNESAVMGEGVDSSGLTSEYVKILGITWDADKDVFTFTIADMPSPVRCTKRVVLSLIARVFDPLGYVLPYTVTARFLFQEIWRLGLGWDEELPQEMEFMFKRWLSDLDKLTGIEIPRQYFPQPWSQCVGDLELHAFGDASIKGYGACVYLRSRIATGEVKSVLVKSCARVAPLERKTLPRLELLGCLVTAQLLSSVIKALHLSDSVRYFCWSDSMVALGWIRSLPSKWKPWVANRVSTIQSLTKPESWRHIAGTDNPADLVTRGLSAEKLLESDLWWHGPECLRSSELGSSTSVIQLPDDPDVDCERRSGVETVLLSAGFSGVFDLSRFSTMNKALRVISWVLRVADIARKTLVPPLNCLGFEEYRVAKIVFCKLLQREHFEKEFCRLESSGRLHKESKLIKLAPFIDEDGLLRVRGRLQLSELAYESKHPIILPRCHGCKLLVKFAHNFLNHGGVEAMISYLRRDYEIFGVRQMAKDIKRGCVFCKRVDAKACNEPPAPLPRLRVTKAPVFSVTGLDYAGPVFCADYPGQKFYICLFVCGVVRAVHLELVNSLNTDDFLMAFRRFSALRRLPDVVYSDNGKNFVGGDRCLRSYLGPVAPKWNFICPRSPWWGGWWERLVRSVKSGVKKTVGRASLTKSQLETCLCEVSASINSRPLTFVGTDVENKLPLTPNHFLAGQGHQSLDSKVLEDPENVTVENLSMRQQEMQQRLDDFWRIWSHDYLRNLPAAFQKFRKEGNLGVGSVVLIREDNVPRMKWCLGVVQKMFKGRDGVARAVELRTSSGVKTRAIQRLYNLEISERELKGDEVVDGGSCVTGSGVVDDGAGVHSGCSGVPSTGVVSQSAGLFSDAVGSTGYTTSDSVMDIGENGDTCADVEVEGDGRVEVDDGVEDDEVEKEEVERSLGRRKKLPSKFKDFVMY